MLPKAIQVTLNELQITSDPDSWSIRKEKTGISVQLWFPTCAKISKFPQSMLYNLTRVDHGIILIAMSLQTYYLAIPTQSIGDKLVNYSQLLLYESLRKTVTTELVGCVCNETIKTLDLYF